MDERIRAYARLCLERAREELETASENIANGHFQAAVSRAYYAVFYMASAALRYDEEIDVLRVGDGG